MCGLSYSFNTTISEKVNFYVISFLSSSNRLQLTGLAPVNFITSLNWNQSKECVRTICSGSLVTPIDDRLLHTKRKKNKINKNSEC